MQIICWCTYCIHPASKMTVEKELRILRSLLSCCLNHTIAIFMKISSVKWLLHVNRHLNWKRRISVLHFAQVPAAKNKSFHHHKQKEEQSGFSCTLGFMSENVRLASRYSNTHTHEFLEQEKRSQNSFLHFFFASFICKLFFFF